MARPAAAALAGRTRHPPPGAVGGDVLSVGCALAALLAALWPLGWIATVRIARPVSELARVAGELSAGQLRAREELHEGDGDEVGEVAGALRGMADRVARQLADQRALMAAVSHELRSPLGRGRVLVELAREGHAPEGFHDDLQAEVDGMDVLVADLLAGARIDFEALQPVDLDPAEVAARALELAGLSAELLVVRATAQVRADATLLIRALSVLLDNAARYGGSAVTLTVMERGAVIRFEVDDNGPGFGPGEEEQAFQPFWRRGPEGGGVGLGLSLVRQIAAAHGGAAGAVNRDEGGARVWMELAEWLSSAR